MNDCERAGKEECNPTAPSVTNAVADYCANCCTKLKESRCKMSCLTCGFYLSCADFY